MDIKKQNRYTDIFENHEELITKIKHSFLAIDGTKISDHQNDRLVKIIEDIVNSFKKDLQTDISEKHHQASYLTKTIFSLSQEKNGSLSNLYKQIQVLIVIRKVLTENISSMRPDQLIDKEYAHSIWNGLDDVILNLCRRYERENAKYTQRDKSIIEKLKIVKNDLQRQLNSTYQLIRDLPIGLAGCDADLNIKLWNPTAVSMTGYQPADIIGNSILNIFSLPSQPVFLSQLTHEYSRIKRLKLNIQTKEGGIFNAFVFNNKLTTEVKQNIQYIINFIDLSKDEKLKSQFEKIEQLSAIARLSDAIMHDVRNPINSLALNIDVLTQLFSEKSSFSGEFTEILNKINRQISNLTNILNYYIGYSKITELQFEPIDIREPINELILDTCHQILGRNINITYHGSDKKLLIYGDWNLLIRVFRNLMDNAIDAIGNKGNIDVFVKKRNKHVVISMVDNGRGIKSENLPNVFRPYFTDKVKGSGLGLFIVREIVRAHNGKVYCYSTVNQGSRFTVSIPAMIE